MERSQSRGHILGTPSMASLYGLLESVNVPNKSQAHLLSKPTQNMHSLAMPIDGCKGFIYH